MNDFNPFEDEIRKSYHLPEMDAAFACRLERDLQVLQSKQYQPAVKTGRLRRAYVLVLLSILLVLLFAIGPHKVWAQIQQWLGYVPGIGLVGSDNQIMILGAPLQVEREGVLLEIDSGIFTLEKSIIQYSFFDVPYPDFRPDMQFEQCSEGAYLETADGNRYVEIRRGEFQGLPAGTESVTLAIPCIADTFLGSAPEDWHVSLHLQPVPVEAIATLTLYVLPDVKEEQATEPTARLESEVTQTPLLPTRASQTQTVVATAGAQPVVDGIQVRAAIPDRDSLILLGSFAIPSGIKAGSWLLEDAIEIRDSLGNPINTRIPEDYHSLVDSLGGEPSHNWALQFKLTSHQFPLQLRQLLVTTRPLLESSLDYEIYLPDDLDYVDRMTLDQDLQIDGHAFHLQSFGLAGEHNAWLILDKGPEVYDIRLQVIDPETQHCLESTQTQEVDGRLIINFELPETAGRRLLLHFYQPVVVDKKYTLSTTWTPDAQVISSLVDTEDVPRVCLSYAQYQAPAPDRAAIPTGKILIGRNTDRAGGELILYNLDGSDAQVLGTQGGWDGALSPDGSKVFYLGNLDHSMHILDTLSGEDELLPLTSLTSGTQPVWSPDGGMIAFYSDTPSILRLEDQTIVSIQTYARARIDGWSPENELYITEMAYEGNPGRTRAYNIAGGSNHEVSWPDMLVHSTNAHPLSAENGRFIYTNFDGTEAYIYDPANRETTTLVEGLHVYNLGWAGNDWAFLSIERGSGKSPATMLVNPLTCQTIRLSYVEDKANFGMVMDAVIP